MKRGLMVSIGIAGVLCVDVRIGDSRYLDCLNEMFKGAAKSPGQDSSTSNPATIPAPAAGLYNQAATRETLGQSFGHSVIPARPPQPHYARLPR
jgi:hypothetical protein